jgi:hypothetical protein
MSKDAADARGARRENRSKSKERGQGFGSASAPVANEFLEDDLAGGSAQPSRNIEGGGANSSQDQTTVLPTQQAGGGNSQQGDLPPASTQAAAMKLLPNRPPPEQPTTSRLQHAQPANALAVPPNVQVQQLLQGDGVYHFDASAFQRFLEFERRQHELQQQFDRRQLELERQGRAPYER